MQCHKAREAWTASRYSNTQPPQAMQDHLQTCQACQAFMAQSEHLNDLLAHDTNESPRPGFDTRFFARLNELKQENAKPAPLPTVWQRWRWATLAGGLVASISVAMVAVVFAPHAGLGPEDAQLALNLDLLQEDVGMLQHLDDAEAYADLAKIPEGTQP